jgi:leucokinin receptor
MSATVIMLTNISFPVFSVESKPNITNDTIEEHEGIYEVPTWLVIFLSLCYCLISFTSVAGNSMVIWIVARSSRMKSVTNYFIANLGLADILIGAFAIPFQFQAALLQRWNLPWFMCSFCPTVQALSVNVSMFTLTVIALDRYRAVIYPLTAATSKLHIKFLIGGIWSLAFMLAIPTWIAFNVELMFDNETNEYSIPICHNTGLSAKMFRHYNHILVTVQYFIPLIIISFAYLRMGYVLQLDNQTPANSRVDPTSIERNKKRVSANYNLISKIILLYYLIIHD